MFSKCYFSKCFIVLCVDLNRQGGANRFEVLPGTTVHAANERRPEMAIHAGDLIYAVNEVRGDTEKMLAELQKSDSPSFLMCRRPVIF